MRKRPPGLCNLAGRAELLNPLATGLAEAMAQLRQAGFSLALIHSASQ